MAIDFSKPQVDLEQEEEERAAVCLALLFSINDLKNYTVSDGERIPKDQIGKGSEKQLMGMVIHNAAGILLQQDKLEPQTIVKNMQNFFDNPAQIELIVKASLAKANASSSIIYEQSRFSRNTYKKEHDPSNELKSLAVEAVKFIDVFKNSLASRASGPRKLRRDYNPSLSPFIEAVVAMQNNKTKTLGQGGDVGEKEALMVERRSRENLRDFCKDVCPKEGVGSLEGLLLEKKVNFALKNAAGLETGAKNESILDFLYRDYVAVKAEGASRLGSFAEFRQYVADSLTPKASLGRDFFLTNKKGTEERKDFRENAALTVCDVRPYSVLSRDNRKVVLPTYPVLLMLSDPNVPESKLPNLKAQYDKLVAKTKEKEKNPRYLRFETASATYSNLERKIRQDLGSQALLRKEEKSELARPVGQAASAFSSKSGVDEKNIAQIRRASKEFGAEGKLTQRPEQSKKLSGGGFVATRADRRGSDYGPENKAGSGAGDVSFSQKGGGVSLEGGRRGTGKVQSIIEAFGGRKTNPYAAKKSDSWAVKAQKQAGLKSDGDEFSR